MISKVGITERGDASLDISWLHWVSDYNPAILITKNPEKLLSYLSSIQNPNIIVHCTITGFGGTPVEQKVPAPTMALEGYKSLVDYLGSDRIVLRVDPVIPTKKGIQRAKNVILAARNTRVRISFLDVYPHVRERFLSAGLTSPNYNFHAPLETRQQAFEELQNCTETEIEVCGEPGFLCLGCISKIDCQILGVSATKQTGKQRTSCNCLVLKKELLNNKKRCPYKCLYCYWK